MSEPIYSSDTPQRAEVFPPQGSGQSQQYVPGKPPPKKSRVGLWIALGITLFVVGGGAFIGAIFFFNKEVRPVVESVAASQKEVETVSQKISVVTPDQLGGRSKITDPQMQLAAKRMKNTLSIQVKNDTDVAVGFYGDMDKEDILSFFAFSKAFTNPEEDVKKLFENVTSGILINEHQEINPGTLGGKARCGDGVSADGQNVPMAVCGWADGGSAGMVTWYKKSVNEIKAEFLTIRSQIEQRN